jgi:hypothetical protein
MRQFAVQRAFFEPAPEFADSGHLNLNHFLMLAIERALAPPFVHRRNVFQPMQIVVVEPARVQTTPEARQSELPRLLPPAPAVAKFGPSQFHQRAVRGEILSDESGRLYEKLGRQIRRIHQLASGQFGEVIDVAPAPPTRRPIPPAPDPVETSAHSKSEAAEEPEAIKNVSTTKSEFVPLRQPQMQPPPSSHRKLFADPGHWRVLWFGEFKEILGRQLAHPERLRDTYRLPCYVQVLEIERTMSVDELAAIYKSDNEHQARFYFLTDEIAARLDLVLPLRPAPALHARRAPNTLLAHERVFRLLTANDPTIDVTVSQGKREPSASQAEPSVGTTKTAEPATVTLKEIIPAAFVKEWEFKFSREEVVYDINLKPSFGDVVRKLCRKIRIVRRNKELRKWQTLLAGRSVDEQLWVVRPPAGTLAESLMREWAGRTLALGGYDSRKMLREWEIFWRRRGV